MTSEALPITALIATIRGWPDARAAVCRIAPQVAAAGGEFIVVDASAKPAPSATDIGPGGEVVRWLALPGQSVFQMRLAGYRAARGAVIAITEDHVDVAPDWIARILAAHARYPAAGAIGGAVLNTTNEKLVDWAAFFLTQGPFMPPLHNGVAPRISGPANVSYKRRVLERLGGDEEQGVIDFLELPSALAGYRRRKMTRGDWLRILSSPVLPSYRAVRQMRIVRGKELQDGMTAARMAQALPAHIWFQYCAMAGELLGYAAGPGESPRRLF